MDKAVDLVLLTRNKNRFLDHYVPLEGSLSAITIEEADLSKKAPSASSDILIHGASVPTAVLSKEELRSNSMVTENLKRYALSKKLKRVVFLSTGSVYWLNQEIKPPFQASTEFSEDRAHDNKYALNKLDEERSWADFCKKNDLNILY